MSNPGGSNFKSLFTPLKICTCATAKWTRLHCVASSAGHSPSRVRLLQPVLCALCRLYTGRPHKLIMKRQAQVLQSTVSCWALAAGIQASLTAALETEPSFIYWQEFCPPFNFQPCACVSITTRDGPSHQQSYTIAVTAIPGGGSSCTDPHDVFGK